MACSGHELQPLTHKQLQKAEARLNARQRSVLLNKHPEAAHSGLTANGFKFDTSLKGTYVCCLGGAPEPH